MRRERGRRRELHPTLLKTDTSKSAPLWPSLIKGHPDIDVSKLQVWSRSRFTYDLGEVLLMTAGTFLLQRQEQTLEQMMAEYKSSEIAEGMSALEREKKKQL